MHVTYWNTPRCLFDDSLTASYMVDFWSFQLTDQGNWCLGITESVWIVPGTLQCE